MKNTLVISAALIFTSCYTYHSFVEVKPQIGIPKGSTEFTVSTGLDGIKASLKENTILYHPNDFGLETEEILLDEGTRAQYKIYVLDSNSVKVVPWWGYTAKVQSEVSLWTGSTGNSMDNQMQRIVYSTQNPQSRPNKVYQYGVQIFGKDRTVVHK